MVPKTPSDPGEWTYRDYRDAIETHVLAAKEAMDEFGEDFETIDDAVRYSIDGARLITQRGHMLQTVFWSDTDPDNPDYIEPWVVYAGTVDAETTWTEVVQHMAYVCVYDDVVAELKGGDDDR